MPCSSKPVFIGIIKLEDGTEIYSGPFASIKEADDDMDRRVARDGLEDQLDMLTAVQLEPPVV